MVISIGRHVECVDLRPGQPKIGLSDKIEATTV